MKRFFILFCVLICTLSAQAQISTFPWCENFDSITSGVPAGWDNSEHSKPMFFHSDILWNKYSTLGHSGSSSMYFNCTSSSTNHSASLRTPQIILPQTGAKKLTFWFINNASVNNLEVYISNDNGTTYTLIENGLASSNQTTWEYEEISLANYAGDTIYVKIKVTALTNSSRQNAYVDDVAVDDAGCAQPGKISFGAPSTSAMTMSWTPGSSETSYVLNLNVSGDTTYSVSTTLSSTSYTINNLAAGSSYTISGTLRSICSIGDTSAARNINRSFKTECEANTAYPYIENFENTQFPSDCWKSVSSLSTSAWSRVTTNKHLGSACAGSGKADAGNIAYLCTGYMNFAVGTEYQVKLWVDRQSQNTYRNADMYLRVYVGPNSNDTTGAILLDSIHVNYTDYPAEAAIGWYEYVYDIPTTLTGNQFVMFAYKNTAGAYVNVYIDDITIRQKPSCADLKGVFSTSDITTTTARVSISDTTAVNWQVGYRPNGSDTAYTIVSNVNGQQFIDITGLTDDSYYEIAVRRDCGTCQGEWSFSQQLHTRCLPVASLPFLEDFETYDNGFLAGCYDVINAVGTYNTYYAGIINNEAISYSGTKFFSGLYSQTSTSPSNFQGTVGAYREFQLDSTKFYEISVYARKNTATSNDYPVSFNYGIGIDSLSELGTASVSSLDYAKYVAYFRGPATGTYYLGFTAGNSSYNSVIVDNFAVRELSMLPPLDISVNAITSTSANINFTVSNPAEIVVDTVSDNVLLGRTAHLTNITASPANLSGLNPSTTYYYALRCVTSSDTSVWSLTGSFTTNCAPDEAPFLTDYEMEEVNSRLSGCWKQTASSGTYGFSVLSGTQYNNTAAGQKGVTVTQSATASYNTSTSDTLTAVRYANLYAGSYYEVSAFAKKQNVTWQDYSYNLAFVCGTEMDSLAPFGTLDVNDVDWQKHTAYITVPVTGEYLIGFRTLPKENYYYAYIDDYSITEVSIIPPTSIATENITPSSADVVFVSTEHKWEIELYAAANDSLILNDSNVTNSPYHLTGLDDNSDFKYRMRSVNGTDTSSWSVFVKFHTPCSPVSVIPFVDDFENYSNGYLSGCYTQYSENSYCLGVLTGTNYNVTEDGNKGLSAISSPTASWATSTNGLHAAFRNFNLEAGKYYEISIQAHRAAGTYAKDYFIGFEVMSDTAVFDVTSYPRTKLKAVSNTTFQKKRAYVTLPTDGVYQVGFVVAPTEGYSANIYLDEFGVREVSCVSVEPEISVLSDTSVTLNFGSDSNSVYQVQLYSDLDSLIYDSIMTVNSDITISGLLSETTYKYSVRKICQPGDTADWSDAISFTTPCAARQLPFSDDFESYVATTPLEGCYIPFNGNNKLYVLEDSICNNTPEGTKGLTIKSTYTATPAMTTADVGFTDYVHFSAGIYYEISIMARTLGYSYDVTFNVSRNGKTQDGVTFYQQSLDVTDSAFQKMSSYVYSASENDCFITIHCPSEESHYIYLDDYSVNEIQVIEITDTVCYGADYNKNGFTISADEIEVGLNKFEYRTTDNEMDTIHALSLTMLPETETGVVNDDACEGIYYINGEKITITSDTVIYSTTQNEFGCDSTTQYNLKYIEDCDSTASVGNVSLTTVSLIPNPVNAGQTSFIYGNFSNVKSVDVLNSFGQIIYTFVPTGYPIEVSVVDAAGIYYVRVTSDDGKVAVQKLIVK